MRLIGGTAARPACNDAPVWEAPRCGADDNGGINSLLRAVPQGERQFRWNPPGEGSGVPLPRLLGKMEGPRCKYAGLGCTCRPPCGRRVGKSDGRRTSAGGKQGRHSRRTQKKRRRNCQGPCCEHRSNWRCSIGAKRVQLSAFFIAKPLDAASLAESQTCGLRQSRSVLHCAVRH